MTVYMVCPKRSYVYKSVILQILGYINVVPFKMLPIRHNTLVPPPFPLLEAPFEFLFSQALQQRCHFTFSRRHIPQMPPPQHQFAFGEQGKISGG